MWSDQSNIQEQETKSKQDKQEYNTDCSTSPKGFAPTSQEKKASQDKKIKYMTKCFINHR